MFDIILLYFACNISSLHRMESGEGLAHSHITAKFGVRFRCVAGPCKALPASFLYGVQCLRSKLRSQIVITKIILFWKMKAKSITTGL